MVRFKGEAEKEVNGKKLSFKWNMAALCLLGDIQNRSMSQLAREFLNPKFSTLSNFLYVGAVEFYKQSKKPIDFSTDDAAEWLDIIGIDKTLDLLSTAFETPEDLEAGKALEKNQTAQV